MGNPIKTGTMSRKLYGSKKFALEEMEEKERRSRGRNCTEELKCLRREIVSERGEKGQGIL